MSPAEFRAALDTLGWSARSLARLLGRRPNTVIAWGHPARGGPPDDVAAWIGLWLDHLRQHPPPPTAR